MKLYLNKLNIMVIMLWFAIFSFYIPYKDLYYIYQFILGLILLMINLSEIKKISNALLLLLYPLSIAISCFINSHNILYTQVLRGITLSFIIIDIYLVFHKYARIRGLDSLFSLLYKLSKLYFSVNIIWIAVQFLQGVLENSIQNETLFMKGKFSTAYIMLFFLVLFQLVWNGNKIINKKYKKELFIFLVGICIVICVMVETATGVMAIASFLLIMFLPNKIIQVISKPTFYASFIIGSMVIIFSLNIILSNPIVKTLIVNVLHEDLSLTGRLELYKLLHPLIIKSGAWGSGFGSYVVSSLAYHGWYNAQNGLSEIILSYGYIGGMTFLVMVFFSSKTMYFKAPPINVAIFVFILVSIVEIPYNTWFIVLLALLKCSDIKNI